MVKPRPTDEEFEELKRVRDAALSEVVDAICAKHGWDRSKTYVHASGLGPCYCACPEGPCQHIWDGPIEEGCNYASSTCSRCGTSSMSHSMRTCEL